MNYKPGTAAYKLRRSTKKVANKYILQVTCDANDGDYMESKMEWEAEDMTELDILMIAYLNLNTRSIPKQWKDAQALKEADRNLPFGGTYVGENDRFGLTSDDEYADYNLAEYARYADLLLFCGANDSSCHSIEDISVDYYDENGVKYNCEMPDLGEMFDSEQEFIDYVKPLLVKVNNDRF